MSKADCRKLFLASQQLVKLWRKKYLEREERTDPTGGIIYRYRISKL